MFGSFSGAGPLPGALLGAIVSMAAMDHAHLPGAQPPSSGSGPDPTQVCLGGRHLQQYCCMHAET